MNRIERLRALKNGLPTDLEDAPLVRRRLQTEPSTEDALTPDQEATVMRLLSMVELGFLAAAADGELSPDELGNLAANLQEWLGQELDSDLIGGLFETWLDALQQQGLEGRLAALASTLDPQAARGAFGLACAVVVADLEVMDAELDVLGVIAAAIGIPEDEAQERFDEFVAYVNEVA